MHVRGCKHLRPVAAYFYTLRYVTRTCFTPPFLNDSAMYVFMLPRGILKGAGIRSAVAGITVPEIRANLHYP